MTPIISEHDLAQLSPSARVALAARCARRVFPWVLQGSRDADVLERAIRAAELFANTGEHGGQGLLDLFEEAADLATRRDGSDRASGDIDDPVSAAYWAAAFAARCAKRRGNDVDAVRTAVLIATEVVDTWAAGTGQGGALNEVYVDFLAVQEQDKVRDHDNELDEASWAFGSLWPNGVPDWADQSAPRPLPEEMLKNLNEEMRLPFASATATLKTGGLSIGPPVLSVVWAASDVSKDDYLEISSLLGELVRDYGAVGLKKLKRQLAEAGIEALL